MKSEKKLLGLISVLFKNLKAKLGILNELGNIFSILSFSTEEIPTILHLFHFIEKNMKYMFYNIKIYFVML